MRSNYAVWSGYQLDDLSFKDFMSTLLGRPMVPDQDIVDLIEAYTSWKRRLPPNQRSKAPNIRWRASDPKEEHITHIFFPVRWIPYKSRRQLKDPNHPDYAVAHEPTEKDKAKLERWLDCADEKLGGERHVKRDAFEFSVMKDLHPTFEWRVY